MTEKYYSQRHDGTSTSITIADFAYRFFHIYCDFKMKGYFGRLEDDVKDRKGGKLRRELGIVFGRKSIEMFPTLSNLPKMDSSSIFDLIEFLSKYVSAPNEERYSFNNSRYTTKKGEEKWRKTINEYLVLLNPSYILTENNKIEILPASAGLLRLVDNHANPSPDMQEKIEHACKLFLKHNATIHDKRDALKNLVDILEPLRNGVVEKLGKKNTSKLFDIANNYGIRHNNKDQMKLDENYMLWFFYTTLAAIDLMSNLRES